MIQISQYKISPEEDSALISKIASDYGFSTDSIKVFQIVKKALDARKKPQLLYVYTINLTLDEKIETKLLRKYRNIQRIDSVKKYELPKSGTNELKNRPVIIGTGPAGLFCADLLAQKGFRPILIEQGEKVEERSQTVEAFWSTSKLNVYSNVQFGEGGAGTFSDGKLNTGVKDRAGRNAYVLDTFISYGANPEIAYDSKPHIGTDILRIIIRNMRNSLTEQGAEFMFSHCFKELILDENRNVKGVCILDIKNNREITIPTECCILAIGHSARDTFQNLYENGLQLEQKPFAIGLRVIHSQEYINRCQYGEDYSKRYPMLLPSAPYKLTAQTSSGRGVYSFCMCPGGYVVNASSEQGRVAVNGMSNSKRDSGYANSAIVVSVSPNDYEDKHPLAGMYYQQKLEQKTAEYCNGMIPVQYWLDFLHHTRTYDERDSICNGIMGGFAFADLSDLFSEQVFHAFLEGMQSFDKIMPGFASWNPLLCAIESRTSSPVKIPRNESFISTNTNGLYPCGEGAGYAGGIMSAAMDGMKVAEAIISAYAPPKP